MSIGDWDIYKSDPSAVVTLDVLTPLEGAASVQLDVENPLPSTDHHINLVPSDAGPHPHGVITGRLRSIIRIDLTDSGGSAHYYGLTCMMNQNDMTGSSGTCYMASFWATGNAALRDIRLHKMVNGFEGGGEIELGMYDLPGGFVNGDFFPFELQWITDTVQLNGVKLDVRVGNMGDTDYVNLDASSPVISVVDTVSPYITSVAEGIAIREGGISTFDLTTLFTLV